MLLLCTQPFSVSELLIPHLIEHSYLVDIIDSCFVTVNPGDKKTKVALEREKLQQSDANCKVTNIYFDHKHEPNILVCLFAYVFHTTCLYNTGNNYAL